MFSFGCLLRLASVTFTTPIPHPDSLPHPTSARAQAVRHNPSLASKPPLVTRIARTGLGTRLPSHVNFPVTFLTQSIYSRSRMMVRNQHQFCSRRIDLTPKYYILRPETRHRRPHQSSQYAAFPSQAWDQCFTRLAKMRRNTITYWTTADFANRKTCSFIRLNDAFRKLCGRRLERNLEN